VLRSAAQKWATTKTAAKQRIAANFGHNQEMPGLIDPIGLRKGKGQFSVARFGRNAEHYKAIRRRGTEA
jgi:hypothetical protein